MNLINFPSLDFKISAYMIHLLLHYSFFKGWRFYTLDFTCPFISQVFQSVFCLSSNLFVPLQHSSSAYNDIQVSHIHKVPSIILPPWDTTLPVPLQPSNFLDSVYTWCLHFNFHLILSFVHLINKVRLPKITIDQLVMWSFLLIITFLK